MNIYRIKEGIHNWLKGFLLISIVRNKQNPRKQNRVMLKLNRLTKLLKMRVNGNIYSFYLGILHLTIFGTVYNDKLVHLYRFLICRQFNYKILQPQCLYSKILSMRSMKKCFDASISTVESYRNKHRLTLMFKSKYSLLIFPGSSLLIVWVDHVNVINQSWTCLRRETGS